MAKEITKAFILQEIQDKFKLRELTPSKFIFEETVVPIYSIEEHLRRSIARSSTRSVTGTGGITFFTVPDDEKYFLNGYSVIFITGTYTVAGVYITRVDSPTYFMYLDLTAGQNTSYANFLNRQLTLSPGDAININIDGYTATGNLQMYIDYEMETIR